MTDVEAFSLLTSGWGSKAERNMEQTEIIHRPGADTDELVTRWEPFIHTHHYDLHDDWFDSWAAQHPRRSGEAYWNQYLEAKFIENNPVPRDIEDLTELVTWFRPLLDAEDRAGIK